MEKKTPFTLLLSQLSSNSFTHFHYTHLHNNLSLFQPMDLQETDDLKLTPEIISEQSDTNTLTSSNISDEDGAIILLENKEIKMNELLSKKRIRNTTKSKKGTKKIKKTKLNNNKKTH